MTRRLLALSLLLTAPAAGAQQISIPRVEIMPAVPPDYFLRDWDRVATGYDSLVFDVSHTGTYFPLVGLYASGVNYPEHGGFGIETYVGSGNEIPGEAINVLPALVGGTLAGANKRSQFGTDWVLRSEQFFNRRPEENVYLNGPVATSGGDWWYDTMPNVFFYQLRALYPGVGEFDEQFGRVAEQWLRAVGALGGSAMPWTVPSFEYRGIALATMTPNAAGVHEPEAAGAVAWLLYMAYRETGDERFRIGAEWALEELDGRTQNPSYELQLPYGALAAARMNAELGTHYDIAKMVTWSFDRGPLRGWGTIAGISRGGYTLDGLVGEVDGDGYAFALNGFQQAAALVPLVRYDDRFARAIGRWMVNLASASRLFYRPYLPDANQDSEAWGEAHDPRGLVGYEALRGTWQGTSPFATGDAIRNGWAPTNLGLYGSSSVGYLAAIVDATEETGVVRLDLRRTDFYRGNSYASYLIYNPHSTARAVSIPLTFGTYDVYDAATDAFLERGVQGSATVSIPPDEARVLVFPTNGGVETTSGGRLLVNGIVVDYRHGVPGDRPPRVKALVATDTTVSRGQTTTLHCTGADAEGAVTVAWSATGGTLVPAGAVATWSGAEIGDFDVTCAVADGAAQTTAATLTLHVVANQAPEGVMVTAEPDIVDPGGTSALVCAASDPDGDPLTYTWTAAAGQVVPNGASATYTAPGVVGYYTVQCTATDPSGASSSGDVHVTAGRLVLHLALDGAATDASGFGNDGQVDGATATSGRDGGADGALLFDGVDDRVSVPGHPTLNPTDAITVAIWARPTSLPNRESFLVSHGSWQNRLKLSITPEGRPRWTVRTIAGVVDVDAPVALAAGAWVHLAATYDGAALRIYVNGQLAAEQAHAGAMPPVAFPLLLGQMLPGQAEYNFAGALDDAHVFNRALDAAEVEALYDGTIASEPGPGPGAITLGRPFPNPSRGRVSITVRAGRSSTAVVTIVDVLGRTVATLLDGPVTAGTQTLTWDAAPGTPAAGVYLVRAVSGDWNAARPFLITR